MRNRVLLVKSVHILIFFFMAACLGYLLYAAITLTFNGLLVATVACLGIEGIILLVNGCHCPLTRLAERFGAANGAITHLFLPPFFARNMFRISFPLAMGTVIFLAARYLGR